MRAVIKNLKGNRKTRSLTRKRMRGGSEKISVVIPTYNRFKYLLNTITSIQEQTYKNIEIIVVNDNSTQPEYYTHKYDASIVVINLEKNTREIYGHACAAHVRNEGIRVAKGKYIAFCDDDDTWLPNKVELQIKAMKESGCKASCTEGLIGNGVYDKAKSYKKYNAEQHFKKLQRKYRKAGSSLLESAFPTVWNTEFLKVHNCVITSSMMIAKEVIDRIGGFKNVPNGKEDYDCWMRVLKHTDIVYVHEPCVYYDTAHGDGRQY